jgi:hypothetical protein
MTTDSGTYKFELDFVEKKELPEAPLIISGPLEELKNIRDGLLYLMHKCDKNDWPMIGASIARLAEKNEEAIRDQEFENLNQNA